MTDNLFRPTITGGPDTRTAPPWNPQSIAYPAFFGGPLAALVLGLLNLRRLGAGRGAALTIAAAGVLGVAARLGIVVAADTGAGNHLARGLTGFAVWGVVMFVQKRPYRVFVLGTDGDPASLVWPGLAAAIGCGLLEAVLLWLAVEAI